MFGVFLHYIVFLCNIIAQKAVLHAINSHVLTSTNPCINKAIHMLLMHGFVVLRISILGLS